MNSNIFPKILLVGIIATVAFVYFDPMRPTDTEVKAAILAGLLLAPDEGAVTSVKVRRGYGGQRTGDGFRARVWPVTATITQGKKEHPYHDFVIWKSDGGHWLAEHNDPKNPDWARIGLLGWGKFGL